MPKDVSKLSQKRYNTRTNVKNIASDYLLPANYKAGIQPPEDEDGMFLVDMILGRRLKAEGVYEYHIRWLGWVSKHVDC